MASNVFGNPVTDETVKLVYPNKTTITAKDRSEVARKYMNADKKATNVSKFVHNLKADYGKGTSTLCMIYNATGGDLTFDCPYNWNGLVWKSPCPRLIQNGQWAGFLHARDFAMLDPWPSKGAVVYRGANDDGIPCNWVLAWKTPTINVLCTNRVFTEISESSASVDWEAIGDAMEGYNHASASLGCYSSVSIGSGSSPEFVGLMTLGQLGV